MVKPKLTRNGIAYNFKESPYRVTIDYPEGDSIVFVFSSELYVNKFKRKIEDNRQKINFSLSNRFGFLIENNKIADLKLYSMTETRGFLILGKEEYRCLDDIILDGTNQI